MVQFVVGVPEDGNLEESIANDSSIFCLLCVLLILIVVFGV